MIYVMQEKSGPQYSPMFDYGRGLFESPIAVLDDPELLKTRYIPEEKDRPWMPSFLRCERIPEHMMWRVPKQIFHECTKPWKQLPDISQRAVTERFHDLIEKFDPGGHQFFPVEIIHKKSGKPYSSQGQFYLWNRLPKACPYELFDYPSLDAKGLLKITSYETSCYKLYQILSPRYTDTGTTHNSYVAKRAGFGKNHIICCLPCGSVPQVEDIHASNIWPLVTEEFKTAALALGVNSQHFHEIPTIEE